MIVDTRNIAALLKESKEPGEKTLSLILKKAEKGKGLGLDESAILLSIKDPFHLQLLCDKAGEVKQKIFGRRVVLFAPLYLSNFCKNACLYCGFRSANQGLKRKALDEEEVVREAKALEKMGFKRILLVTGEDPQRGVDYIVRSVRAIYENTGIRIIHVNAPPTDVPELKELKKSGVGVYQAFQETYHRLTYESMHPAGPKKDYNYRIAVMDRAFAAGFNDVGIGALLGLYDFRFDCLSTIAHSKHLFENFKTHAHTISVPRLRPAQGSSLESLDS
ncbi:MAG: radical SAM protein, partial [Deltaproteobacteria bacterium]|nr:radical SAM protein [Deltaproteobacteria bacterium]